jgi:hypothetical protein
VQGVLCTRATSAESRGRRAELKSAYLSNSESVVVVELSSSEGTSFWEAEYTARDGYGQAASSTALATCRPGKRLWASSLRGGAARRHAAHPVRH